MEEKKFADFGFCDELMNGLDAMGFENATPIQRDAIPAVLAGRDIMGVAQTGTGKTAAFLLPILEKITRHGSNDKIKALVVVPTRELAVQIDQALEGFSYFTPVSSLAVYGGGDGAEFTREKKAMMSGAEVIIGTPGRLISHLNMGYADLSNLDFFILDEADRMLDMGFYGDILRIMKHTPDKKQTLLFSATMPSRIHKLSQELLNNPVHIQIALSKPSEKIIQGAYLVRDNQKLSLLESIFKGKEMERVIVFSSTKRNVSNITRLLKAKGINAEAISSDLEQKERERVLLDFRNQKIKILVATDVVSRGIDIEDIELVINFDVPGDAEDYVHRIGRTARAQKSGLALSLIAPDEQHKFKRIEELIGSEVRKLPLPENLESGPDYHAPKSNRNKSSHKGKRPFRHGKKSTKDQ